MNCWAASISSRTCNTYGSGGIAGTITDAAGVRFLAVNDAHRGKGTGKALTRFCIERARALGKARLVLHTTRTMTSAWTMYEGLGFVRFPEIDFRQGDLEVFGFQLPGMIARALHRLPSAPSSAIHPRRRAFLLSAFSSSALGQKYG